MSEPQQGPTSPWQPPRPEGPYDQSAAQQEPTWSSAGATWQPTESTGTGNRAGLAVAALVVGGVSVLLSWVPFVNLLAVLGGLAAIALGIAGVVLVRKRTHGGRGMAITGIAAGAVALVIALAVDTVVGLSIVDSVQDDASASSTSDPEAAPIEPGSPSPGEDAPSSPAPASPATLALGQSATVGDYTVAVTAVDPAADDAILQANPYNPPPSGQYVLADVTVVYNGTEEGTAWIDLTPEYEGTDARNYASTSCSAVLPNPGYDQPTLRQGGTTTYQVCFDLPADAIAGGRIGVTSGYLLDSPEEFWQVDGSGSGV